jgi:hypothetical protein
MYFSFNLKKKTFLLYSLFSYVFLANPAKINILQEAEKISKSEREKKNWKKSRVSKKKDWKEAFEKENECLKIRIIFKIFTKSFFFFFN